MEATGLPAFIEPGSGHFSVSLTTFKEAVRVRRGMACDPLPSDASRTNCDCDVEIVEHAFALAVARAVSFSAITAAPVDGLCPELVRICWRPGLPPVPSTGV